jgi:rRNA maturation endonuclease Nob1
MAEYIERKATIKRIKEVYCVGCNSYNGVRCRACGTGDAIDIIEDAPAADVAPVVHGRWDNSGRYTFPGGGTAVRCTNCGCALTESKYRLNNWNYCPVCGAMTYGGADHEVD